ncbi:hypothetical protein ACLOJK_010888 [Asimina triloba]
MALAALSPPFSSSLHSSLIQRLPLSPPIIPSPLKKTTTTFTTRALLSSTRESVLKSFHERKALKVIIPDPSLLLLPFIRLLSHLDHSCPSCESVPCPWESSWEEKNLPCDRFCYKEILSMVFWDRKNHFAESFVSALHIISGLQNFERENVASVVTAADKGGATHVDIACDPELVKVATGITSLPVCVSSVDPKAFLDAVAAGAHMVEIGNYDSFYDMGRVFSPEEILLLTKETKRILPSVVLSVTVPHSLSLPEQMKLAELLEQEGADIIQTEGGKCSSPSKPGVLGLIEKATPTLAAAYSISRAVKIPVLCSSGLSAVTAPMALTAGAAGVGVGSAVNKLNDMVAMIAEVKSIADSLGLSTSTKEMRTAVP